MIMDKKLHTSQERQAPEVLSAASTRLEELRAAESTLYTGIVHEFPRVVRIVGDVEYEEEPAQQPVTTPNQPAIAPEAAPEPFPEVPKDGQAMIDYWRQRAHEEAA